jgi:hypothetical protein
MGIGRASDQENGPNRRRFQVPDGKQQIEKRIFKKNITFNTCSVNPA